MDTPGHDPERPTAGEGDWLGRVRAFDWSSTPLGPQVLRAGLPLVARSDGSPFLFVGA